MSDEAIDEERLNRRLKKQIALMNDDQIELTNMVEDLEKKHMLLVQHSLQVDWDLRYVDQNDEEPLQPENNFDDTRGYKDLTIALKQDIQEKKDVARISHEILSFELQKRAKTNLFGISGASLKFNPTSESGVRRVRISELKIQSLSKN